MARITGNSSFSSMTDVSTIVRFSVFAILTFGYRVPNQNSVWLIMHGVKIVFSASWWLIRCGVSNVSSGPRPSTGFGAIAWFVVSNNLSGVLSFPGFNIIGIITHLIWYYHIIAMRVQVVERALVLSYLISCWSG